MAGEIQAVAPAGRTLYALVRNGAAQVWHTGTHVFETYTAGHYAAYAVPLIGQGAGGYYVGDLPPGITAAGLYSIAAYLQTGVGPGESDPAIATGQVAWDGTAEIVLTPAALQAAASAALHAAPDALGTLTPESVAESVVLARAVLAGQATISGDGQSVTWLRHDGVTEAVHRSFPQSVITTPTLPETVHTSA